MKKPHATIAAAVVLTLAAAGGRAEDLMSLYRDALKNDAAYQSARAGYEASKERLPQGRALLLPSLNVDGNYKYNNLDIQYDAPSPPSGQRTFGSWGVGLNLTQPLFRPANVSAYDQAQLSVTQAGYQFNGAVQDLMVRVSQSYFDVLLARANLNAIKSQKVAIAEQLAQAKRNFEVGTATITDTYDAQARYDLVVSQEIVANNELQVKIRALEVLIGRPADDLAQPRVPIPLNAPEPNDMEKWVEQAYQTNPQVLAAHSGVGIAAKEIEKTKSTNNLPTLDAIGQLRYDSQNNSAIGIGQDSRQFILGVQLAYPLYAGGSLTSKVRESVANKAKSDQDLENTRRQVAQQTRQAFLGVNSGLSQIKALEQAVASNKLSLDASKLGMEVGVRTQVDVLDAEQRLTNARRGLAESYYQAIMSQIRLKSAVGLLTEGDLDALNQILH